MPTDDWKQTRLKVAGRGLFVEEERKKEKWKEASYSKMSRSTASTSSSSVELRRIEGVQSLGRQKEMKAGFDKGPAASTEQHATSESS